MSYRVLLVESDERLARFWEGTLVQEGLSVEIAPDAESALGAAQTSQPDLIFLGTPLVGEEGWRLLRNLREHRPDLLMIAPLNSEALRDQLAAIQEQDPHYTKIKVDQVIYTIKQALSPRVSLAEVEQRLIQEALALVEGNQTRAAKRLGISRFALRNRMRRYGFLSKGTRNRFLVPFERRGLDG